MKTLGLIVIFATVASACDGAGSDPDQLVGTWELANPDGTVSHRLVFTTSGQVTQTYRTLPATSGTYLADDRSLVFDLAYNGARTRETLPYTVIGKRLFLGVSTSQGAHQGMLGTWVLDFHHDQLTGDGSLVKSSESRHQLLLRSDGTAHLVIVTDGVTTTDAEGKYQPEDLPRVFSLRVKSADSEAIYPRAFTYTDGVMAATALDRR